MCPDGRETINQESAATARLCDVKGCGKEATERVVERERPNIGVPVCATHAFALTLGDFYVREANRGS